MVLLLLLLPLPMPCGRCTHHPLLLLLLLLLLLQPLPMVPDWRGSPLPVPGCEGGRSWTCSRGVQEEVQHVCAVQCPEGAQERGEERRGLDPAVEVGWTQ